MKKKLIILSSVLVGVIAVLLILMFTLFTVRDISFKAHNQNDYDTSSIEIKKGGVVLFLNKNQIVNDIEKNHPMINVINIETVFPNKLVVHFAEREEIFAVFDSTKNCYYVVDEELVVLKILNASSYNSTQTNAILLEGVNVINENVLVGDILNIRNYQDVILDITDSFLMCNRDIKEQCALIKKVECSFDSSQEILSNDGLVLTFYTFDDFKIIIYAPSFKLTEKIHITLTALPSCLPDYLYTHYLEVLENSQNEIFCKLSLKS